MAVTVKMGVDISEFNSAIKSGQAILKGLNAEMKSTEAEFKNTGNAEKKLTSQTNTLNQTIRVQKGIANEARQAMEKMTQAGINPADVAYQKLYATMVTAEAGANEAQAALNELGAGANAAADGADKLSTGLNGISKKISLDQVISGIGKITDGLENAAKKAVQLGEDIWNTIMESAKWADDTATMAQMYGFDVETFQKMQKLVTNGMDTSVEAMLSSQDKLKKGIGKGSKEVIGYLQELGVSAYEMYGSPKYGPQTQGKARDTLEVFWETGQALMAMSDAYDKEAAAQALFGKSWKELVPLFTEYKTLEEYNAALKNQKVIEEELIENGATMYDTVGELVGNWETLKNTLMLSLAPAMTEVASTLNELLTSVLDYLQTEEGKQMLQDLGDSVSELFSGLRDISAEDVVAGFKNAFDTVLGTLDWIIRNKDTLIGAVEGIFGVWATLKVSSGVLTILKVIDGLKSLAGLGAGAGATVSTGISALLTGATTKVAGIAGNGVLQNFIPGLSDWFVHNTGIGQEYILGTKEKGSTVEEIKHNVETWADQDNPIFNFFRDMGENSIRFWDKFWKGNGPQYTPETIEEADWRPSYMKDQQPVPIETEPEAPADAAEQIADQVGTVVLPVEFRIRSDYANLQGYILKQLTGHANGLPYVPNEGLYHLHKGERVVPAREVDSRSFSSNLYVENMNMGGNVTADALAEAIAGRNRRMMAGYGS